MAKLGISIYPDREPAQRWNDYIELASRFGFSRIFESLLPFGGMKREEIISQYKPINLAAREKGFEIIADVAPSILKDMAVTPTDLSFFNELGVNGFRLDEAFSGMEEAIMTCNPYGLLVEINASVYSHFADTIIDYQPVRSNLIGCHNFYPQRYTGLSNEHFKKTTSKFKSLGLRLAAFVTSQAENSFGPWPWMDGLPTLEAHRDLPIECQITHMLAHGDIDDILISNCFASESEFIAISEIFGPAAMLDVILDKRTSPTERKILFDELHISRGDVSDKIIRSTWPRIKYAETTIKLFNPSTMIKRGDVLVNSEQYDKYAGEMHIALSDFPNTGKANVVGRIRPEELIAIDEIKPWQKFKLRLFHEE